MKLYYHPVSTTNRIVMMFAAEEGIDLEYEVVEGFAASVKDQPFVAV